MFSDPPLTVSVSTSDLKEKVALLKKPKSKSIKVKYSFHFEKCVWLAGRYI